MASYAAANAKLMRQLKKLESIDRDPVRRFVARAVVWHAKKLAPVDTGWLKSSIHEDDGNVVVDAPHAVYVEFGTEHMEAQPFLRPALDANMNAIKEAHRAATIVELKKALQ